MEGGRDGGEEGMKWSKGWRGGRDGGRKGWRGGRDGGRKHKGESLKRTATLTSTALHSIPMLPGCRRRYES